MRRAIWLAVLIGVFLLNRYVAHQAPKTQLIGSLKPWQVFSVVQVEGVLLAPVRELKSGGWFGQLADESGTVFLFLKQWPTSIQNKAGTQIVARGRLLFNQRHSMRLQASSVKKRPEKSVVLHGRISSLLAPPEHSKAPWRIRLEGLAQPIELIFWFSPPKAIHQGAIT